MKYGYARISSYSQKLDRQIKALTDVGCDMVITDKESGKNFDRKGYKRLMRRLNKG
ncbi:recombinase family protein, partial [Streptococcus suis]